MKNLKSELKTDVVTFRLKKIQRLNIELAAAKQNISKGAYIRQQLFNTN
jgi:hypothetical protein